MSKSFDGKICNVSIFVGEPGKDNVVTCTRMSAERYTEIDALYDTELAEGHVKPYGFFGVPVDSSKAGGSTTSRPFNIPSLGLAVVAR